MLLLGHRATLAALYQKQTMLSAASLRLLFYAPMLPTCGKTSAAAAATLNRHSFREELLSWKLTITGIWLADIPRSGDAGTRLLSWTLLRFRRFVETFVPPGDTTQHVFLLLSPPPPDAQTCTPVVFPCCTKLNIQPSFGILGTYLCYKAGYKFLRKVCMGENTADCVSG